MPGIELCAADLEEPKVERSFLLQLPGWVTLDSAAAPEGLIGETKGGHKSAAHDSWHYKSLAAHLDLSMFLFPSLQAGPEAAWRLGLQAICSGARGLERLTVLP